MTSDDPSRHRRHSIRLRGYDYAQPGAYFVTLCAWQRLSIFAGLTDGQIQLNDWGQIVARCWTWLGEQYPYIQLDEWVVMPNHFHGIIVINPAPAGGGGSEPGRPGGGGWESATAGRGGSRPAPTIRKPLGQLIGAFKTVSAKRINIMRGTSMPPVWQRNYYEHIVRDDRGLNAIRNYIRNNPAKWVLDRDNLANGCPEAATVEVYVQEAGHG